MVQFWSVIFVFKLSLYINWCLSDCSALIVRARRHPELERPYEEEERIINWEHISCSFRICCDHICMKRHSLCCCKWSHAIKLTYILILISDLLWQKMGGEGGGGLKLLITGKNVTWGLFDELSVFDFCVSVCVCICRESILSFLCCSVLILAHKLL